MTRSFFQAVYTCTSVLTYVYALLFITGVSREVTICRRGQGHNCDLVQLGDVSYNQATHKKLL